jgi:hypothetical protein
MDGIFGFQFYPTPPALVEQLLRGINWLKVATALEPEAGKGDIANVVANEIRSTCGYHKQKSWTPDVDCIEIDPNLRSVLNGLGLRVVHDDFLTFRSWKRYDLIAMNPPFAEGDKHLLKALEMQRDGGMIRCILNAETLRNPYTRTRQDLARRLEETGADIEFLRAGFVDGERPTDVEVAIVRVDIPQREKPSIILDDLRKAAEVKDDIDVTIGEMVDSDPIRALISSYEFEVQAGLALIHEFQRVDRLMRKPIGPNEERGWGCLNLTLGRLSHNATTATPNELISETRRKYWTALFAHPKFTGVLTSELRKDYLARVDMLVDYDFSAFNIWTIRAQFMDKVIGGIDKAILDLFERLSHENAWDKDSKNIHYYNGWKTNKSWKINEKVIRPNYVVRKDQYMEEVRFRSYGNEADELSDIEKVFRYLDGKPIADGSAIKTIADAVEHGQLRSIETTYFTVTFYLKGTCHIKFTKPDLLKKFNIYGARNRKWLPPSYGKATYADMAPEERAVVDDFEGEHEYARTMARRDFFLAGPEQMLGMTSTFQALPMPAEVAA